MHIIGVSGDIRDFNNTLVNEYVEQMSDTPRSSDGRSSRGQMSSGGDMAAANMLDTISEAVFSFRAAPDQDCKEKMSPELKLVFVLVGIVGAFMVVSHVHLARLRG